jgi:hypothetical protein
LGERESQDSMQCKLVRMQSKPGEAHTLFALIVLQSLGADEILEDVIAECEAKESVASQLQHFVTTLFREKNVDTLGSCDRFGM